MTVCTAIVLFMLTAVAGFVGGLTNYLMLKKDDAAAADFSRSAMLGIVASFVVPLFLKTISSDVAEKVSQMELSKAIPFDLFVYFAFCLLAAYFSKNFLETMSQQLVDLKNKLAETDREVSDAKEQVDPIINLRSEPGPSSPASLVSTSLPPMKDIPLEETDEKILKALTNEKYSYRTVEGIAGETKTDGADVLRRLENLRGLALVGKRKSTARELWFLTNKGHDLITLKG